jgi:hypothetical protein
MEHTLQMNMYILSEKTIFFSYKWFINFHDLYQYKDVVYLFIIGKWFV